MGKKLIDILILFYVLINIYWFEKNYIDIYPVIFSIAMVLMYFTFREKVKTTKKGNSYSYFKKKGYNYYSITAQDLNLTTKEFIVNGKITEKFSLDLLKKYTTEELTAILKTYFTITKAKNIQDENLLKNLLLNIYMYFADINTKNLKIEVNKEIIVTYKFVSHELNDEEIDEVTEKLKNTIDLIRNKMYDI